MATPDRNWLFWCLWAVVAVALGAGTGALIGSTKVAAGTTMAVVTGMGCVIGLGAIAKALVERVDQGQKQGWQSLAVRVGFLVGAVNLAVGLVLAPIAIGNIVWPLATISWTPIGIVIGAVSAPLGGLLSGRVIAHAQSSPSNLE